MLLYFVKLLCRKVNSQNLEGRAYTLSTKIKTWGGRKAQEIGDVCIHIADSQCCSETNTTL